MEKEVVYLYKTVIDLSKKTIETKTFTTEELAKIELQEIEQSSQPSPEEINEADYELKLITKLIEWGIL